MRDEQLAPLPRTPEAIRAASADYYGMIAHLDAAIGRILQPGQTGRSTNTIIVYTADHGLALGQHGLMGKQNLYEHSMHVPLMIAGPGIPAGRRVPALVWHATPARRSSISQASRLNRTPKGRACCRWRAGSHGSAGDVGGSLPDQPSHDPRRTLEADPLLRAAALPGTARPRRGRPAKGSSVEQLFDLAEDPGERINLVFRRDLRTVRKRLSDELEAWQRAVNDPMLLSPGYGAVRSM